MCVVYVCVFVVALHSPRAGLYAIASNAHHQHHHHNVQQSLYIRIEADTEIRRNGETNNTAEENAHQKYYILSDNRAASVSPIHVESIANGCASGV